MDEVPREELAILYFFACYLLSRDVLHDAVEPISYFLLSEPGPSFGSHYAMIRGARRGERKLYIIIAAGVVLQSALNSGGHSFPVFFHHGRDGQRELNF